MPITSEFVSNFWSLSYSWRA